MLGDDDDDDDDDDLYNEFSVTDGKYTLCKVTKFLQATVYVHSITTCYIYLTWLKSCSRPADHETAAMVG